MESINHFIQHGWNNSIKCSQGNAEKMPHRELKQRVCNFLYEHSINFSTEVTFTNGKRADIVVLDWGIAIEILHSETIKDFKKKSYPILSLPVQTSVFDESYSGLMALTRMLDDIKTCAGSNVDYYIKKFIGESV